jgi:tetraacyldisaccharide 4'-kinase
MTEPTLGRRILAGETGAWAWPARAVLRAGEAVYGAAIRWRNARYDDPRHVARVDAPVISVGNITVGGTGKTPMVIELVRRLESAGRNPAVVARGYGGSAGQPGDEELLVRKACPAAVYVGDFDRRRGAQRAVREMGADVIVLDDAFQHRRLHRDLDIVLIDALCPFGYGHVLPRGLLREPIAGLSRAHAIVITRQDQASRNEVRRIESVVREHNRDAPVLYSRTKVIDLVYLDGTNIEPGSLRRVLAFAAIGRPQGFAATLAGMGFDTVASRWWPDHHRYREREVLRMLEDSRHPPYDLAVTTEKDAVKLEPLTGLDPRSIGVVRIGVEFSSDDNAMLDRLVERIVGCSPVHSA